MDDFLKELIGINVEEIDEISDVIKQQATDIVKISSTEEWKRIESYLNLKLEEIPRPVEYYAENEKRALFDSGYKRALLDLKSFIEKQKQILDQVLEQQKYAEKT